MAATVTVVSCSPATLGGGGNDTGNSCPGGYAVAARCVRACDGAVTIPNDGVACPDGFVYSPAYCARGDVALITNMCGADAARDGDGADASDGGAAGGTGGSGGGGAGGSGGGGAGGGMGEGAGGAGGGGNVPGCTDLVNDAPPAVQRFFMEERPATELGVGGEFADGVYDLNVIDYYGTARQSGTPIRGTVRISNGGTRMESVTWYEQGNVVSADVRTLAPAGTQVTETWICPVWGPNVEGYSATPTRFLLSNPMTVSKYVRRAN